MRVYYPPQGQPGSTLIADTTLVSGTGVLTVNYGPGPTTEVEVVVNEGGGQPGTLWNYNITLTPNVATGRAGLIKLGSQRLNLQGDGTYTGPVDVRQGILRAQNDTALGTATSAPVSNNNNNEAVINTTTTVEAGAALEIKASTPTEAGGISAGLQVWNENLVLKGAGNTNFASVQTLTVTGNAGDTFALTFNGQTTPFLPYNVAGSGGTQPTDSLQNALNSLSSINSGGGSVTVSQAGNVYTITFGGTLAATDPPLLVSTVTGTASAVVTGSVATLTSLDSDNMWRGPATLATNAIIDVQANSRLNLYGAIDDAPNLGPTGSGITKIGTGELVLSGSSTFRGTTSVNSGILTVANGQALGATGSAEVQSVTVSGASGSFTLTFDGQTTIPLAFNATAADVQSALSALNSIGPSGGFVTVVKAGNVYTVTFNGPLTGFDLPLMSATPTGMTAVVAPVVDGAGGTVVANGAQIQVQGSISVGGEPLTLQGTGQAAGVAPTGIPLRWFSMGPGGINNGQTVGNNTVTGRVTSVVVDPSDSNVIYISAAGGGAWKTKDGGKTWHPLIDVAVTDATGTPIPVQDMYAGAIAISPGDPRVIYVALGEANNSVDSYYGVGVLKSTDSGHTWALTSQPAGLVFNRRSITKIVVDPTNPNAFFVTVDGTGTTGGTAGGFYNLPGNGSSQNTLPGGGGLWYFDGVNWNALTSGKSPTDQPNITFTGNEDYSDFVIRDVNFVNFPQTFRIMAVAVGSADGNYINGNGGIPTLPASPPNGVYVSIDGGQTWQLNAFPLTDVVNGARLFNHSGVIKLAMSVTPQNNIQQIFVHIYASIAYPDNYDYSGNATVNNRTLWGSFYEVREATVIYDRINGSATFGTPYPPSLIWPAGPVVTSATLGNPFGTGLNGQGNFDNVIAVNPTNPNIVLLGGVGSGIGQPATSGPWISNDGGQTWTDIGGLNANTVTPDAPHYGYLGWTFDSTAANRLLVATTGGLFRLENPGAGQNIYQWSDLNGNLNVTQFNGVAPSPTDTSVALGSSQANGAEVFTGAQPWTATDTGDGGGVAYDPKNPLVAYHVRNGQLMKSTDGGQTWVPLPLLNGNFTLQGFAAQNDLQWSENFASPVNLVLNAQNPPTPGSPYMPFVIDQNNPQRIVVGGGTRLSANKIPSGTVLQESLNGGATWTDLSGPLDAISLPAPNFGPSLEQWYKVSGIAISTFQGQFVADPRFSLVTDQGTNNPDPNTMYAIIADYTNGRQQAPAVLAQQRLAMSKNHGVTWVDITPAAFVGASTTNAAFTDIEVDPRNRDTAYLVRSSFNSAGAGKIFRTTDGGQTWTDISAGLPDLPAWKVVIDPRNGNLYLGTDNGVYTLPGGAGSWVPFGSGMPMVQVNDLVLNTSLNTLTAGTYGRGAFQLFLDDVQPNSGALRATSGTSVWTGPIKVAGPVTITASGSQALSNGQTAAQIDLAGNISDLNTGGNYKITKAGNGNVIFSGSNAYGGITEVNQGVLVVHNPNALGSRLATVQSFTLGGVNTGTYQLTFNGSQTGVLNFNASAATVQAALAGLPSIPAGGVVTVTQAGNVFTVTFGGTMVGSNQSLLTAQAFGGTTVLVRPVLNGYGGTSAGTIVDAGTALQLQTNLNLEPILLNGDGISFNGHNTGTLRNVSNNNTYTGVLTLGSNTTIGVDSGSSLTIAGPGTIVDGAGGPYALTKESTGTLFLTSANTYGGGTNIDQGIINIQNGAALGAGGTTTSVLDGAQLQIQGGITVLNESLRLSGSGIFGTGALESLGGANRWESNVTLGSFPGFSPATIPPTAVSIGVLPTGVNDNLTIDGIIGQIAGTFGINKVGGGNLVFNNSNAYGGVTTVAGGVLRLQQPGALGNLPTATVQTVTVTGAAGNFTLTFNGQTTQPALSFNATAAQVQSALNALPSIAGLGGSVAVTLAGSVFTVTFGGSLLGFALPAMTATFSGGTTVAVNITAPGAGAAVVNSGASLQLDMDPTNSGATTTVNNKPVMLNGLGLAPVQAVTVGGSPSGSFTLSFNGQPTGNLLANSTAAQVAAALNALPSINGVGGSVTVTPLSNGYTITFGGTFLGSNVPLLTTTQLGGTTAVVTPIVNGSAALENISGANTWANGSVVLNSNTSIGVDGGTLTTTGTVTGVPTTSLTKLGAGELLFPTANIYQGQTTIQAGVLNASNSLSLGGPTTSSVQAVTITGPAGNFTLQFGANTTGQLSSSATAAQVQTALDGLPSINKSGTGFVTVTQLGNVYTITFGGSLAAAPQPNLIATGIGGTVATVASVVAGGLGGTTVTNGATLQLQGGITVTGENLTLNGPGFNNAGALQNLTGTNTWNNVVTLGSNVFLGSGAAEVQAVTTTGGGFTLSFNGGSSTSFASPPSAAQMQAQLNVLATIGGVGGSVTVTQAGNVYSVTFNGTLAGSHQPLLGVTGAAAVSLVTDGAGGAGTVILSQQITDNGSNFSVTKVGPGLVQYAGSTANAYTGLTQINDGTLQLNKSGGALAILGNLTLGNALATAEVQTVTVTPGAFSLTFNGSTAVFASTPTAVQMMGQLNALPSIGGVGGSVFVTLNAGVFNVAFGGTLAGATLPLLSATGNAAVSRVTAGAEPFNPTLGTAQWLGDSQIPSTDPITVNFDGVLDLNGHTQTTGAVQITDGMVTTGNGGQLTVAGLTMIGGTVNLPTSASQLTLNGTLNATSDTVGSAAINSAASPAGTVALVAANRTFNVTKGLQTNDLVVNAAVTGAASALTKIGSGRVVLAQTNSYANGTTINAGEVQVDGTIGNVTLNGGTASLSGLGTIGNVTSTLGTVNPGDNGPPAVTGTLTSAAAAATNVTFNSATTFFVDLNSPDSSPGVPGTGHDVFTVNGNISLGGATAAGLVSNLVLLGQQFTIVQTTGGGTISGKFAEPNGANIAFLGGKKFTVTYNPTSVVLQLIKADVIIAVVPSADPSVYGQDFSYTVTVNPQPGAGAIPPADTVSFHFYNNGNSVNISQTLALSSNQVTFDPQTFANLTLPVGTYHVDVTFSGDANFFNAVTTPAGLGTVIEYPSLGANQKPQGITGGPDGNIWFAVQAGSIGRITPNGQVTLFNSGIPAGSHPQYVTTGSDGNLWFTQQNPDAIGRITPGGAVTQFTAGLTAGAGVSGITLGPDGNVWFTEFNGNRIGTITPAGTITEYSTGITAASGPQGIVAGPDGNLWFTEATGNRIGRITVNGVVTEFAGGITSGANPQSIAAGADGNLWFTEGGTGFIGRITTSGSVSEISTGISPNRAPAGITAGTDGNLWFTQANPAEIGRITTAGTITEYSTGITAASASVGNRLGPGWQPLVHGKRPHQRQPRGPDRTLSPYPDGYGQSHHLAPRGDLQPAAQSRPGVCPVGHRHHHHHPDRDARHSQRPVPLRLGDLHARFDALVSGGAQCRRPGDPDPQ